MRTIKVRITLEISVEVPGDNTYDPSFDIEENHCPGTGLVGMTLDKHIDKFRESGYCWACALNGKNEIVG